MVYLPHMTKLLKEAIDAVRELPAERQDIVARALLDFATHDDDVYHLTGEERRDIRAGLAEIESGDIASDEDVATVYHHLGL